FLSALLCFIFSLNDTSTTEIYTLSLHDALPISNNSNKHAILFVAGIFNTTFIASIKIRVTPSKHRLPAFPPLDLDKLRSLALLPQHCLLASLQYVYVVSSLCSFFDLLAIVLAFLVMFYFLYFFYLYLCDSY